MACRVTATAKSGKYPIVTDVLHRSGRNTVLMRIDVQSPQAQAEAARLPALRSVRSHRQRQRRRWAGQRRRRRGHGRRIHRPSDPRRVGPGHGDQCRQPRLRPAGPRRAGRARSRRPPSGFAGTASDGLVQLDGSHALDPIDPDATDGNVVQTARVSAQRQRQDRPGTRLRGLADDAIAAAEGSLAADLRRRSGRLRDGLARVRRDADQARRKARRVEGQAARSSSTTPTT